MPVKVERQPHYLRDFLKIAMTPDSYLIQEDWPSSSLQNLFEDS